MTNTASPITLAERLQSVPLGRLAVRLALARQRFVWSQTRGPRIAAMEEIEAIKAEYQRRGVPLEPI